MHIKTNSPPSSQILNFTAIWLSGYNIIYFRNPNFVQTQIILYNNIVKSNGGKIKNLWTRKNVRFVKPDSAEICMTDISLFNHIAYKTLRDHTTLTLNWLSFSLKYLIYRTCRNVKDESRGGLVRTTFDYM